MSLFVCVSLLCSHHVLSVSTSSHLLIEAQDQRLGAERDQLFCGSTGISSRNCQDTETLMVRSCHAPQQRLQNPPSGYLGGWVTPWSAEEMLNGQCQRVDSLPTQICSQWLPAEKTGRRSLLNRPSSSPPPTDHLIGQRTELN